MHKVSRGKARSKGDVVLWTPWGPVPDHGGRADGKVTRLRPREPRLRHQRIGFDMRPFEADPRQAVTALRVTRRMPASPGRAGG